MADLDGRDQEGLHIDVGVLLVECVRCDADGALLEGACELLDLFGQRGREHQRAALCRGCLEDGLELFAEAHVEHLVGLVEDGNLEARKIEPAAAEMVAESSGRTDDNGGTHIERAGLGAGIGAADAGGNHPFVTGRGAGVEPGELTGHLGGQLTRRRNDQRARAGAGREVFFVAEDGVGHGEPKGNGFTGAGAGGDEQVGFARGVGDHCLNRGRSLVALREKSLEESGMRRVGGKHGAQCLAGFSSQRAVIVDPHFGAAERWRLARAPWRR